VFFVFFGSPTLDEKNRRWMVEFVIYERILDQKKTLICLLV